MSSIRACIITSAANEWVAALLVLALCMPNFTALARKHDLVDETSNNFDVLSFGAVGDGVNDDTEAFLRAWSAVCHGTTGISTLTIQEGTTMNLRPLNLQGPCGSSTVHIQIAGTIVAPTDMSQWVNCTSNSWLSFSHVDNLVIDGSGMFNAQGALWWNKKPVYDESGCNRPTALLFGYCPNLQLTGLTHLNSPKTHISLFSSDGATLSYLNITAPESSPNTDGIGIGFSTSVSIHNSNIRTGDDCVAIIGNSSNINITSVACGPGHGISIGSLGGSGETDMVEYVHVFNCSFTQTQNGVRIKTWQGGSGFARNIIFEQIQLEAAHNPIIIDQFYDNFEDPHSNDVKVSNVTYRGVQGSSASEEAITLSCSSILCTDIIMDNVNITSSIPSKQVVANCSNAQGQSTQTYPAVPCLSPHI